MCTLGSITTTYTPGVHNQPAPSQVDVQGNLGICVSTDPGAGTGTYTEHATVTLSRTDLLAQGTGTRTFTWQDGATSLFAFQRIVNNVNGTLVNTFQGTITAGKFQGHTATQAITIPGTSLTACSSPEGLTSATGTGIPTIV
ncbi:hypothetical protein [Kitasatospora sp. NPDC004272]